MSYESGMYTGTTIQEFKDAEAWLGKDLDFISWSVSKANWSDWSSTIADSVRELQWLGTDVHWTIPLFADGGTLSAAANHAYDGYYVQAAKELAATIKPGETLVIRTGEEFNGSWATWSAGGQEGLFAQAYRDFVDAFRSVSSAFRFEWNVGVSATSADIAKAYPGDAYVDYVGGDLYWDSSKSWSVTDPNQAFYYYRTTTNGLDDLADFAVAHGKPLAFSEWSVNSDNASAFISQFHDWLGAHDVAYQSYWDSNGGGFAGEISTGAYPHTAATFKQAFGVNDPHAMHLDMV